MLRRAQAKPHRRILPPAQARARLRQRQARRIRLRARQTRQPHRPAQPIRMRLRPRGRLQLRLRRPPAAQATSLLRHRPARFRRITAQLLLARPARLTRTPRVALLPPRHPQRIRARPARPRAAIALISLPLARSRTRMLPALTRTRMPPTRVKAMPTDCRKRLLRCRCSDCSVSALSSPD